MAPFAGRGKTLRRPRPGKQAERDQPQDVAAGGSAMGLEQPRQVEPGQGPAREPEEQADGGGHFEQARGLNSCEAGPHGNPS